MSREQDEIFDAIAAGAEQPRTQQARSSRNAIPNGTGDYATLDIVKLAHAHGLYGRDLGNGKHAICCPWEHEHSSGDGAADSDTVIWEASDGTRPGFCCQHSHCSGRRIREFIEELGDADRFCSRSWQRSANSANIVAGSVEPATAWEPPIPFGEFDLPPFPTEALPDWQRDFVEAEATATQTPRDLTALAALAACGVPLAKRFEISVRPGWTEPLNVWTLSVTRPGTRSSQVFQDVAAPIAEYERRQNETLRPEIAEAAARYEIAKQRAEKARGQAARAPDPPDRAALEEEACRLAREVAEMDVAVAPRFLADDVSPEKLASLLAEQGGRMAILSPEGGGVFELIGGRYSQNNAPNLEIFLKSHAGDDLRVDRIGRAAEFVQRPALTLGLRVQPDVIRSLANKPGFRGRGLLARFLYSLPEDMLGSREVNPPPVPAEIERRYRESLHHLFLIAPCTDAEGREVPYLLTVAAEAQHCLTEFMSWLEPKLGEWGELGTVTDWAGKLAGLAARIAGIMHMAGGVGRCRPWEEAVQERTMEAALSIARYSIPHTRAAFAQMGADPAVEEARHLLRWIERHGQPVFSKRACFEGVKGRFHKVVAMEPALRILIDHNYIREHVAEGGRGPGRPTELFDVNPLTQRAQYSQKGL